MSLKGNLQSVDLANVLQMLSINQKEGTLVLFDGDTRKSIYFSKDGVSMLSRGRKGQDSLGKILLRYGRITAQVLKDALARQEAENRRLGEVLEEMGVVTANDIDDAIRTQIEEEIYNLFIWKEASFEFIEGPPPDGGEGAATRVTFNVNSLIMEAQRRADEWNYIRGLVPSLDEIYRPTDKMAEAVVTDEVFHFPFAPGVLEKLQVGRLNVSEIIDASHAAKFEACKILAILLEQGAIEPVTIADLQAFAQEASSKGDHRQAAKFLSRVVDLGGATPPVNLFLGYALEAMDEPERASIYLRAAAESYVEAMEPKHAFDAYQRIARNLPTDVAAVTQMVEIACNNPDILAPNRHEVTEAGRILAQCLRELARLPAAIQILNSLVQSSPQDMPLRTMLVQAYQDSGMLTEAMTELEAMSDFSASQKNWDEAIRCLRRVVAIDRNRPGVLKKIEAYTRNRDSGKRFILRIVAAATVLLSILACYFGFSYYKDSLTKKQQEGQTAASDQLDPLRKEFDEAEADFKRAYGNLADNRWKENDVQSVQTDMDTMDKAVRDMEAKSNATATTATRLYQEYKSSLPSNFVADRTTRLKERFLDARSKRETMTGDISGGTLDAFSTLWPAIQTHPLRNTPAVTRQLGLLKAVKASTVTSVDNKLLDLSVVLKQLDSYAKELKDTQVKADDLWNAGKYRESEAALAEFLGTYFTVTEFAEILRFRVHVTAVPAFATVRALGGSDTAAPAPRDLEYAAAGGLNFEVAAPGFQALRVEIPLVKGGFNAALLMERLPYEQKVVLTKVPVWTVPLGPAGIDAPPVPTADGRGLVVADRNGFIFLLSADDGRKLQGVDCRSVSGFRGSPLVTADSVFAATPDGVVVALDLPSLQERWRKEPADGPGPVYGSPVLAGGLLIVAASPVNTGAGGRVFAFDPATGAKRWETKLETGTTQALLNIRGWIFATCEDGRGRTLDLAGKESIVVLPSAREEAGYTPPRSRSIAAGDRVLFGLEGAGKEFSLVELPVPGAASPHIGYKWGALVKDAEVSGACLAGEDIYLLFSDGTGWRVSARVGPRPNDLKARLVGEKEVPFKEPAYQDGILFVATSKGLSAAKPGNAEFVEAWKWTAPEGNPITTPPVVVGKFVVVGSRDGRVFALLRD